MIIPPELQIFESEVHLSDKDFMRLKPLIANWYPVLCSVLSTTAAPDVERMIVMELMGQKRVRILERLLARYGKHQRAELKKKVEALL